MTTLTLELPPQLAQALAARRIGEQEAQRIALAALELSVQRGISPVPTSPGEGAAGFARNLIDANRSLFEELARR
jgi:hypothetical protein